MEDADCDTNCCADITDEELGVCLAEEWCRLTP
jgi:hypothetical protein